MLEIQAHTDLQAPWTRIGISVDTTGYLRIETIILGDDERVLNGSIDATTSLATPQM